MTERLGGNGILIQADLADFDEAVLRVHGLMKDGAWYPAWDVIEASQQREGLRRMRELRRLGFYIEKRRMEGKRDWEYRLLASAPVDPRQARMAL